jgi:ankyrin repeat protein
MHYLNDLGRAIKREDVAEVRRLLSLGPDVNATCGSHPDTQGETPLMLAASRGKTAIMKLLLDVGANPNESWPGQWSSLARAAASKSAAAVILLLQRGADPTRTPRLRCVVGARQCGRCATPSASGRSRFGSKNSHNCFGSSVASDSADASLRYCHWPRDLPRRMWQRHCSQYAN